MKLYLIDGSGYLYREFYGVRPLSTADGTPTNAVYGVAKKLLALVKEENPDHICVCFDAHGPTFRHEKFAQYKANRPPAPAELIPQFPLVRQLIQAMGIPQWEEVGYEADDLLGTLANKGLEAGYEVYVYSGDKDLAQLVRPGVIMRNPFVPGCEYQAGQLIEKMGIYPNQVIDYLAMMGDSSDNIPGVPKVGAKTAAKLLGEYGSLENILAHVDQLTPPSIRTSFTENRQLALLSQELATIKQDVPGAPVLESLVFAGLDKAALYPFLMGLEMRDLANRLGVTEEIKQAAARSLLLPEISSPKVVPAAAATAETPVAGGNEASTLPTRVTTTQLVTDEASLARLCSAMAAAESVTLEAAAVAQPNNSFMVGLALLCHDTCFYIPLNHRYLGALPCLAPSLVLEKLRPYLEAERPVFGFDLKSLNVQLLNCAGWQIKKPAGDGQLMAYLLDPESDSLDLSVLVEKICGIACPTYDALLGSGRKRQRLEELGEEALQNFLKERLLAINSLCNALYPKLGQCALDKLYQEVELPLSPVLAAMEHHGVKIDAVALMAFGRQLSSDIAGILEQAQKIVGPDTALNIASPQQLAAYFGVKSTDQETLEALAPAQPLAQLVLDYRQLSKLNSTYVEALLKVLDGASRVHTCFNQVRTATGRLSSSDPNLQNIPNRTELGRNIRQAFVAREGYCLLAADYSQIELRMLAHCSQDPAFIAAYRQDEDIHQRTALELFGSSDGNFRRQAKTINFGIIYGLSAFSLAKSLGITNKEAKDYMEAYFGRYPMVRTFMDKVIAEGRERGYVTTIFGHRRYLPNLVHSNGNLRHQAERMAVNTVIQGSAADLIKVAMLRLQDRLQGGGYSSRLLLQVHDELVIEVKDEERLEVLEETVTAMEDAIKLLVPLKVEAHFGRNWAEAH